MENTKKHFDFYEENRSIEKKEKFPYQFTPYPLDWRSRYGSCHDFCHNLAILIVTSIGYDSTRFLSNF